MSFSIFPQVAPRFCCGSGFSLSALRQHVAVCRRGDVLKGIFVLFASRDPLFEFEFEDALFAFA
jgi:hypothetical protein